MPNRANSPFITSLFIDRIKLIGRYRREIDNCCGACWSGHVALQHWHAICIVDRNRAILFQICSETGRFRNEFDIQSGRTIVMRQKKTKLMLAYWLNLFWESGNELDGKGPYFWPERSDIQPAQCRALLGNMFILESKGPEVNYRLAGTSLCSLYGREMKREAFSEVFAGQDRRSAEGWASRLGLDDHVVLLCSSAETAMGDKINLETLLMPLSHHGERSNRVVGITTPAEEPYWLGTRPIVSQNIRSVRVMRPWDKETRFGEAPLAERPSGLPSRRLNVSAPPIYSQQREPANSSDATGARRVAHLTVIDGGRQ